ncbi:MAG: arylsulfatase [Rikenellaceae bacterium]
MKKSIFPLLAVMPLSIHAATNSEKPNIILIVADDLGWSDLGCYGGEIDTPNLDALAEQGLRFNNFHNTGKSFPSRSCLLTGLYAQQNGYYRFYNKPFKNAVTLGEVLRSAGYRTLLSGKHHGVENPHDIGFDRNFGLKDGCCNHFNPGQQRVGEGKPAQKVATRHWCIDGEEYAPYSPVEKDFYTTDYYTNYAIGWLEEYSQEDKPFFLYLAYNAPHDPLQAWPEDIAKYEGVYNVGYEKIREARYEKQLELGIIDEKWVLSDPTHIPWADVDEEERVLEARRMAVYAAMVDRLDQNVGRLISYIDSLGKLDNTLIIFVSDNGCASEVVDLKDDYGDIGSMTRWESLGPDWANVSNTPYRFYKGNSFEGGINTPMIMSWGSGLKAKGEVTNAFSHFIDIMPTLCDVATAEYPTEFDGDQITPMAGVSLLSVMEGKAKFKRDEPLFWEFSVGAAVGDGEWKLVRKTLKTPWSLYNVKDDPTEVNDLADEQQELVDKMDGMFYSWKESLGLNEESTLPPNMKKAVISEK